MSEQWQPIEDIIDMVAGDLSMTFYGGGGILLAALDAQDEAIPVKLPDDIRLCRKVLVQPVPVAEMRTLVAIAARYAHIGSEHGSILEREHIATVTAWLDSLEAQS